MKNLFIHIGAPKTGTTAIQNYLLKNREDLSARGVLYPAGGLFKSAHHTIGAAVFPARAHRLEGVSREEALRQSINGIRKEIEELKPHTVVLSTEYLWGELSPENIQGLLHPFSDWSIKVIAYLRRQDLLAQSLYVQAVKRGLADSFPTWLGRVADSERAGFHFYQVLSCWKNSGTAVDVVVRVYEKSQLKADICTDFLSAVYPDAADLFPIADRVANTGPDQATVEILRLVSRRVTDPKLGAAIRRRILMHSPARALFAPLNYLSADDAADFVARFSQENEKVARDFLRRPDGILFNEGLPSRNSEHSSDLTAETILKRLSNLLAVFQDREERRVIASTIKAVNAAGRRRPVDQQSDLASL